MTITYHAYLINGQGHRIPAPMNKKQGSLTFADVKQGLTNIIPRVLSHPQTAYPGICSEHELHMVFMDELFRNGEVTVKNGRAKLVIAEEKSSCQ